MNEKQNTKARPTLRLGTPQGEQFGWTPTDSEREMLRLNNELIKTEAQRDELQREHARLVEQLRGIHGHCDRIEASNRELLAALKVVKGEMDWIWRNFPRMPKSAMQRLGLRFDWSVVCDAIANAQG